MCIRARGRPAHAAATRRPANPHRVRAALTQRQAGGLLANVRGVTRRARDGLPAAGAGSTSGGRVGGPGVESLPGLFPDAARARQNEQGPGDGQRFVVLPAQVQVRREAPQAVPGRREWREETGLSAEVVRCGMVENLFSWEGRECHEFAFFFRVSLTGELPELMLDNPHVAFRWLPVAELDRYTIYPLCLSQLT